jgi:uncharacterized protein YggT (Ycf19 family)
MTIELLIASILRTFVEVALLSLLGQGAVGLFAGAARERNPIYRFFCVITRPPVRMVRFITPRLVIDKHIPFVAFFVLFWLWILLAYVKRSLAG